MAKAKPKETQNLNKATIEKQVSYLVPKVGIITIILNNHMAVIQIQIGKNTREDVLLDGGSRINIITE